MFACSALIGAASCGDDAPPCPGLPDAIPASWGVTPPGLDVERWNADITARMREGCIPALSVAVVTAEGELMSASWGYANVADEVPATVDTPFMIASASKAVGALAILAARDEGLLELDAPVSELVGFGVHNRRVGGGAPIGLHHLASHSSGIRDNWDVLDETYQPGDPKTPLGEFLEDYLSPGGENFSKRKNYYAWQAGREWFYSNVGAALAAHAVEARAGQPYAEFCEERLFAPLGLARTGWFLADFPAPEEVARPHAIEPAGWRVDEHYGFATWPDGQLRTTARELGRLLRLALADGELDGQRVLAPGALETLTTRPVEGLDDWYIRPYIEDQYYFWFGMTLGERWIVGHDGDDLGVSSEMFFEPETGVGVVLLTNIGDWEHGGRVREQTAAIQELLYQLGEEGA